MKISLPDPSKCTGCGACANRCPKDAIRLQSDSEGFAQPTIDASRCVECHACEKVCPVLNSCRKAESGDLNAWAAFSHDLQERRQSSSGGIFSLLAKKVLAQSGIVFGVKLDEKLNPVMCAIESGEELSLLQGSKYVQAEVESAYQEAENALKSNRLVLFSGTPCQISALKSFLGKDYPNLLSVSFICHGVPSPKIWQDYVKSFGKKATGARFRDKSISWKDYSMALDFEDGTRYCRIYKKDPFIQGFLQHFTMRKACHACAFRYSTWQQDITLADFWKVKKFCRELDSPDGVSLVFSHTPAGDKALEQLRDVAQFQAMPDAMALLKSNPASLFPLPPSPFRSLFWADYSLFDPRKVLSFYTNLKGLRKFFCKITPWRRYCISKEKIQDENL